MERNIYTWIKKPRYSWMKSFTHFMFDLQNQWWCCATACVLCANWDRCVKWWIGRKKVRQRLMPVLVVQASLLAAAWNCYCCCCCCCHCFHPSVTLSPLQETQQQGSKGFWRALEYKNAKRKDSTAKIRARSLGVSLCREWTKAKEEWLQEKEGAAYFYAVSL